MVERRKDGSLSASETRADGTKGATEVTADGSEAVVKTTVLTDGGVAAALDGSATLKVAENAKSFADTASVEGWAGDAIAFVTARSLFGGISEREFAPTQAMDRAMLVTALHRLEDEPDGSAALSGFADGALEGFADAGQISGWAQTAMGWAVGQGLISGKDGGRLDPAAMASRAEVAAILMRFIDRAVGG